MRRNCSGKTRRGRARLAVIGLCLLAGPGAAAVRVVVWDEQQPRQKQAYDNFLGNAIADHLKRQPGFSVESRRLADADQGLPKKLLDNCDVLVWWGHVRQGDISPQKGRAILQRVLDGKMALLILHSAHFSTPFMEAMAWRTRQEAERKIAADYPDRSKVRVEYRGYRRRAPKRTQRREPFIEPRKFPDGTVKLTVQLPNCCFPAYRGDGKPSTMLTVNRKHPVAKGIPARFTIKRTEMYDEPFHVPDPDEVIFEERWPTGEWFRSGAVWDIGKGKLFYFRPGHETYPVFKDPNCLKIVANASRWLAGELPK